MLNDRQWDDAHKIADYLVESNTDVNELNKVITYLRDLIAQQPKNQDTNINVGKQLFTYLKVLVREGKQIAYSNQTPVYYVEIEKACRHLQSYQQFPQTMLEILGWSSRLTYYYKATANNQSTVFNNQVKSKPVKTSNQVGKYQNGQTVVAKVINLVTKKINNKKTKTTVTYEIEQNKLNKSETIYNIEKKGIFLKVGEFVELKITTVHNGMIRKFERLTANSAPL